MYNVKGARIFQNWTKTCYIATKKKGEVIYDDEGNEIKVYNKPEKYRFNIQPVSNSLDILEYGEKVDKMYKAIIPYETYVDKFHEGDIAYLEGVEPQNETEKTYGIGGNYMISGVRPQNTVIAIYFIKIQK